ncbi:MULTISPECIES: ATP-binding protein [unclassified Haematospirillum]|uniref:ATP-binding protein n=1 Tax=unclassified Haematospirillum TaxID=2622088 RepID=UPI0014394B31|nr:MULTISPECIES: ATP-binding protein [unclassified Haematospirillum]NKD54744.1 hypothetical protein [Haematospirillum sp. H4890]NKD74582.1 hypothetical protein [Haematospirillum sp. H4485]
MAVPDRSSRAVAEPLRRMMNAMQVVPRHSSISNGSFVEAARSMTELAVTSLEVEQAGIWLYNEIRSELICQDIYAPMEEGHGRCAPFQVSLLPDYIHDLDRQRLTILTMPEHRAPLSVMIQAGAISAQSQAHLGAHIYSNGRVIGLFGMTTETPRPTWSAEERAFATYLCDVLGTVWQAKLRREAEEELRLLNESLERQIEERTHQIQVQSALMEAVLNNISRGVGCFDADNQLALCNPQFLKILGLPARCSTVGTPLLSITQSGKSGQDLAPLPQAVKDEKGRYVPFSLALQRHNGHIVELEGIPMPHDIGGTVITCTDMTKRIQVEIEIRDAHHAAQTANTALRKSLEDLQRTQKELVESEKLASLGSLVSGIAHEINTPVGVGLTAASLLDESISELEACYEREDLDSETFENFMSGAKETIRMVLGNIERAAELVRSFKNIATNSSSEEIRKINLKQHIKDVVVSLTPRIRQSGVRVETDIPDDITLSTHPGPLGQVMTNLVMNALTHAFPEKKDGNTVWIAARQGTPGTGMTEITVSDNGTGVSPEHLSRLTEPFFTTKRGSGGTGLGLHIVYNIVTGALGGQMHYSSPPGEGLSFRIVLPSLTPHEEGHVS